MARTIGVDPGEAAVKVVEIDGSYRKARLLRVHVQPLVDGTPRAGVVAEATRTAIDDGMRGEVRLGHPCREAVLRTLDLPFKGKDAIRRVVKAEVEGEIHGYVVDDMVVDFHEVGGGIEGGTRILVAAVPKDGLRAQLAALQAVAVEPVSIDLDTMALWRVAHWAGAFAVADGEDGNQLTAVLDVGHKSVRVLIVEGERLVDMRALRLGDGAIAEDIAMRHGLTAAQAREAVLHCAQTGSAQRVEVEDALPMAAGALASDDEGRSSAAKKRIEVVEPEEVEAARAALLQRLQRELFRYLAASGRSGFRAVWLTGGGAALPGLGAVIEEVFGTAPAALDLMAKLQHSLSPEEAEELGPRLATALGLALAPFGGPAGLDLRKEDLASTRGFERIKFPLTIALMVGLLALFVYGNHRAALLNNLELQIGKTYSAQKGDTQFFGMVNSVLVGDWWKDPRRFRYDEGKGRAYGYKELIAEIDAAPVHKRIDLLRSKLRLVAEQKQKESGIYEEVSLESGFAVLVRFSEMMRGVESQLGRYLMTRIELQMRSNKRYLKFTVAFRSDFRTRASALQSAIEAEIAKPDSPFQANEPTVKLLDEDLFKGGGDGAYFTVTMRIKDTFAPFGAAR